MLITGSSVYILWPDSATFLATNKEVKPFIYLEYDHAQPVSFQLNNKYIHWYVGFVVAHDPTTFLTDFIFISSYSVTLKYYIT